MARKNATCKYLQELIKNIQEYSDYIIQETPNRLRNTSGFFQQTKISFYRFNCYIEDESIDIGIRKQLKDHFCYLTACLDEYNLRYVVECKKKKNPFTPEELIAFKRYHKSLDSWAWHKDHENRIAEKIAASQYYVEPYVR